jgi:hypothetical protein
MLSICKIKSNSSDKGGRMKKVIIIFFALNSVISMDGYSKMCYVRSQHGFNSDDFEHIKGKYCVRKRCKSMKEVPSKDPRKICFLDVKEADMRRVKYFLDKRDARELISEEMIQSLLDAKKSGLRMVATILRDFRCTNKTITVEQVRSALGINQ